MKNEEWNRKENFNSRKEDNAMKKFMKSGAVLAIIMILVGTVGASVLTITNKTKYVNEYIEDIFGEKFYGLRRRQEISVQRPTVLESEAIAGSHYPSMEQVEEPVEEFTYYKGDITRQYPFQEDKVKKLKVELEKVNFIIESSDHFAIETIDADNVQAYQEEDTIYIHVSGNTWNYGQITLYVPEGFTFEEAEMKLGAGEIYLDYLNAQEVEIKAGAGDIYIGYLEAEELQMNVGAGNINIDYLEAEELKAKVGAGSASISNVNISELETDIGAGYISLYGEVQEDIKVKCAAGSAELCLDGQEADYNYKMKCSAGNITLNGRDYQGFGVETKIDNRSEHTAELECSLGNIRIDFMNE